MAYDDALAERLREILAGETGVSEKKMFGGLAFLVDGRMVVACSGTGGLLLRVDPADTERLVANEPRASRFVMQGRELNGWLHLDVGRADVSTEGDMADDELSRWVAMGVRYAASLPPK